MKLTAEGRDRIPDLKRFGSHLVRSKDIDPLYPVLAYLQRNLSPEEALWHTFLYVAWYNLPSATAAWRSGFLPNRDILEEFEASWPTGIERRANRGGKVGQHIAAYLHAVTERYDSQAGFLTALHASGTSPDVRHANWRFTNEQLQSLYGNGRWAAYKHCEVLRRVNGLNLLAPDMGHQFSSGPREGLSMLYGELEGQGAEVIAELDARGEDLRRRLARKGLATDPEELETILCNWKSLVKGKYYVGHDIDELQEQIETAWVEHQLIDRAEARRIWRAREVSLPNHYLGELNGWHGVQKQRMPLYRDQRRIVIRRTS